MKRVRRWISRGAYCASVSLFLAMAALWVWSCWQAPVFEYDPALRERYVIWAAQGRICFDLIVLHGGSTYISRTWGYSTSPVNASESWGWECGGTDDGWRFLGMQYMHDLTVLSGRRQYYVIFVPFWMLMVPASALPIARATKWHFGRRTWRMEHRLCLHCGYDMRASPERCPECGTPTPSKT
jgi:hypothetical protein